MEWTCFFALCFLFTVSFQNGQVGGAQPPPPPAHMGCQFEHLDAFSDKVMEHVRDYDKLDCPSLGVDVVTDGQQMLFTPHGKDGVGSVEFQTISADANQGGVIDQYNKDIRIEQNRTGAIQNMLTKACFIPADYDRGKPPAEIEVHFTAKKCRSKQAQFTFTADGVIRHQFTQKCFGPLGGWLRSGTVADNTVLALRDDCSSKFNILHGGVLELAGGKKCIHPLWGGDPHEGKKACLYTTCTAQKRLSYRWYIHEKPLPKHDRTLRSHPIKTEMSYAKINFINDEVMPTYIEYYALAIQKPDVSPSVLPSDVSAKVSVSKPNVVVICIEEASVQNFERKMELTEATMTTMNFLKYKKHSANSDTAVADMTNLILGHSEKSGGSVNNSIFKVAKSNKYVTLFSAEDPATASGVVAGLADVDHNALPFFSVVKRKHQSCGGSLCYCMTGNPLYNITLNYLHSFLHIYKEKPKLAFILFSEVCRKFYDNLAYIGYIDRSMAKLLEYIKTLKNTIVLVKSLKGGTTNALKKLGQGREEVKRPFLAAYVSKDLGKRYSFDVSRAGHLSTALDVHSTLRHILSNSMVTHAHGVSLLTKSRARECTQAGVDRKVCPCFGQGSKG